MIRAAVVQDAPVAFDAAASTAKCLRLISEAAGQGAQLVVFPEAFLSGYPKGLDFGARVGMRSAEGREQFRKYHECSIDVPGPETAAIAESAREHQVFVVIGVIERDGGTLYCTALFFSPVGELLGKHRKLMPTAMERLIWGFGDGSTMPVLDTPIGRMGAVICWENYMPLLRTAMYAQGIELYCAPTVDDRPTWPISMQHIAIEGRCFVLSACQFARRSDYPAWYQLEANAPEPLINGGSVICDPFGKILAGPLTGETGILIADLDLKEIARGKYDLDVTGHYGRPDVFQLNVDTNPKTSVTLS